MGIVLGLSAECFAADEIVWKKLLPGLEYSALKIPQKVTHGDGLFHVVRVDPKIRKLTFALAQENGGKKLTAAEWCKKAKLAVAINAGMFAEDHQSNVGFLRSGKTLNNRRWNSYKSFLAFSPKVGTNESFLFEDLDDAARKKRADEFDSVVQNLRLIKAPGVNVWQKQSKRWSEAAIASDRSGNLLFVFSRSPLSMWDFNESLLKSGLGVERAMHVEGGPEASLSIHVGDLNLDFSGSFETNFFEDDSNTHQWPIPNVLGVLLE